MRICKKCQIEYEEEKKFCSQCGTFLISKETALWDSEGPGETIEEKPKEKFICPECKIIYEKTKTCIRCGKEAVSLATFQERGESSEEQISETVELSSRDKTFEDQRIESPSQHLICPTCKRIHLRGKTCVKCGTGLVQQVPLPEKEKMDISPRPEAKKYEPKSLSPSELEEDLFQGEIPDQRAPKRTVEEQIKEGKFKRKLKKDYPRTAFNWSGISIILIAAGYLLWSIYSHVWPKRPDPMVTPFPKEMAAPLVPTSTAIPPAPLPSQEAYVREQIVELLEKIRKANLEKDIHLFMSCYSKDFKEWEEKKKTTLESWGNFNFLNLTYDLKTCSISGNVVIARVEWLIRFSQKNGGTSQDSKTALEVTLKKEEGAWKIEGIKSLS
jgi:ketosteroid isomerase-like protein/RNA polymerase subunit RPABC4/transcription elongation factor Spt4